ncbi:transposase family protein [Thiomonas sp.]
MGDDRRASKRFVDRIATLSLERTFSDLAREYGVHEKTVRNKHLLRPPCRGDQHPSLRVARVPGHRRDQVRAVLSLGLALGVALESGQALNHPHASPASGRPR